MTAEKLMENLRQCSIGGPAPIDGDINHTEALYLIDRHGDERAGYLWPFKSRFATYDMRVLATRKVA